MFRGAFPFLMITAAAVSSGLAQTPQTGRRLAFDSTNADTVTCRELQVQFLEVRGDPVAGNGFRIMVRNRTTGRVNYDPGAYRAQLKTGRQVGFLSASDVAVEYLEPGRSRAMSNDDREQQRRDIYNDQRLRSGPILPGTQIEKFLALGWDRRVSGDPAALLPLTLTCNRQPLGRINFAAPN